MFIGHPSRISRLLVCSLIRLKNHLVGPHIIKIVISAEESIIGGQDPNEKNLRLNSV